jgi:hypothetical protein
MVREISERRKAAYYAGMALMIAGGVLFASVFVSFAMRFGDVADFESRARSMMIRAFGGMALMVLGGIIRAVGAHGLAGAGVVLDPQRAREDLEPHSRMAGGMLKDALDEAEIRLGSRKPERVVMVKCPACGKLNEEESRFCQECGKPLQ